MEENRDNRRAMQLEVGTTEKLQHFRGQFLVCLKVDIQL